MPRSRSLVSKSRKYCSSMRKPGCSRRSARCKWDPEGSPQCSPRRRPKRSRTRSRSRSTTRASTRNVLSEPPNATADGRGIFEECKKLYSGACSLSSGFEISCGTCVLDRYGEIVCTTKKRPPSVWTKTIRWKVRCGGRDTAMSYPLNDKKFVIGVGNDKVNESGAFRITPPDSFQEGAGDAVICFGPPTYAPQGGNAATVITAGEFDMATARGADSLEEYKNNLDDHLKYMAHVVYALAKLPDPVASMDIKRTIFQQFAMDGKLLCMFKGPLELQNWIMSLTCDDFCLYNIMSAAGDQRIMKEWWNTRGRHDCAAQARKMYEIYMSHSVKHPGRPKRLTYSEVFRLKGATLPLSVKDWNDIVNYDSNVFNNANLESDGARNLMEGFPQHCFA